jgi:hypothetical protein
MAGPGLAFPAPEKVAIRFRHLEMRHIASFLLPIRIFEVHAQVTQIKTFTINCNTNPVRLECACQPYGQLKITSVTVD